MTSPLESNFLHVMPEAQTSTSAQTYSLAVSSFMLAILSTVLGPFGCIPAIICGHIVIARIRHNPEFEGRGLALTGLIIGYGFAVALSLATVGVTWFVYFPQMVEDPLSGIQLNAR